MDDQNPKSQFNTKWKKEVPLKRKKLRSSSRNKKNVFTSFFYDLQKSFKSVLTGMFNTSSENSKKRYKKSKSSGKTITNRSIIRKALKIAWDDLVSFLKNGYSSKKEVRRSELIIKKKIKQKKREEFINSVKNILSFKFLTHKNNKKKSRDTIVISKKIRERKIENFKNKLFKFKNLVDNSEGSGLKNAKISRSKNRNPAGEGFLLKAVLNILMLKFLFIAKPNKQSKDTLVIKRKLQKKKIENLRASLIRILQFKFEKKKLSISEKMYQREQKEIRQKKIKKMISDIKNFPHKSILSIRYGLSKVIFYIKNFRKQWKDIVKNISRINADVELKRRFIYTYTNSTLAFFISFFFINYVFQFITAIICSAYSIPTVLYYFDIVYQVGPYSTLWNRFNIILIYGSAPFFSLFLSVVFYQLYKLSAKKFKYLRIYFLWGMINAFNFFFGAYIVGAITREGFIYFTEWLFFSYMFDIEEIVFLVCCLIALVSIGYFTSDFFLSSAVNRDLISFKNKVYYKFAQIFLPWLSGVLLLVVFNIPNITFYNILMYLSLLLVIFPSMINYQNYKTQQIIIVKTQQKYTFLKWNIIVSLFVILLVRFILNDGIWFN